MGSNEYEIEVMEVAKDYVHMFLGFPLRYSVSEAVQRLKGVSFRGIFGNHPEVEQELWGGEFWEEDIKVTRHVIRKYIKYHNDHETSPQQQLKLF